MFYQPESQTPHESYNSVIMYVYVSLGGDRDPLQPHFNSLTAASIHRESVHILAPRGCCDLQGMISKKRKNEMKLNQFTVEILR